MAESFLDRIAKAKGLTPAQALTEIVKPDPKIAAAGPVKLPSLADLNAGTNGPSRDPRINIGTTGVAPAPLPDDSTVDAVSAPDPMPKSQSPGPVMQVQPKPAPPVQAPSQPASPPVDIPQVPAAPVEIGPAVPQITMDEKPKGIDWNKVGEIAKRTGGSILDVLQAAVAGRTAGLLGKTFNPATDTPSGIKAGKEQDVAAQKDLMNTQFGFSKQLREMDQDFQQRQAAINQAYEDKRIAAEHDYQSTRDAEAYKRAMAQAQADRAAAMDQLKFSRETALQVERTRQGLPTVGGPAVAGADPAGLGQFLPKAAPK